MKSTYFIVNSESQGQLGHTLNTPYLFKSNYELIQHMKTRIKLLKKPFGAKLNEHLFAVYVISITKAPKTTVRK